jgi:hypothetical protein
MTPSSLNAVCSGRATGKYLKICSLFLTIDFVGPDPRSTAGQGPRTHQSNGMNANALFWFIGMTSWFWIES